MRLRNIAISLIIALIFSLAVFAQDNSQKNKPEPAKTEPISTATPKKKPLSTNEDPMMIGKRNINKGMISKMSGSTAKEIAIGRMISAEIDRQAKFVTDPVMNEYVNRLTQNLVLNSDAKIPFSVKIIDSDEINAFALPGGFLYVNKGLLLAAGDEAELAGVIAHEISHSIARHGVENMTKANIISNAANIGLILLGGGVAGTVAQNTAGIGFASLFMKFSRANEEEADSLGAQYVYASGYDAMGLPRMFEKLESLNKKKPGFFGKLFSSHPAPADRRIKVLSLISRFPEREEYVVNTSEFRKMKAKLLRSTAVVIGNDPGDPSSTSEQTKPVLKRRMPDDNTADPDNSDQPKTDDRQPPKLKRNSTPPQEQPSPTPDKP